MSDSTSKSKSVKERQAELLKAMNANSTGKTTPVAINKTPGKATTDAINAQLKEKNDKRKDVVSKQPAGTTVNLTAEADTVLLNKERTDKNKNISKENIDQIIKNSALTFDDKFIDDLKEKIEKITPTRNDNVLVNLAGHPATQYYVLQKEKEYYKGLKDIRTKYPSNSGDDIAGKLKENGDLRNKIIEEISKVLVNGFDKALGIILIQTENRIDDKNFTSNGDSIRDNLKYIQVPITFKDTCPPRQSKGGTRRNFKGSRRTKRRLN